jgi:hypothetical protein
MVKQEVVYLNLLLLAETRQINHPDSYEHKNDEKNSIPNGMKK